MLISIMHNNHEQDFLDTNANRYSDLQTQVLIETQLN